ncbi:DUF6876 family protein [Calidithermus chliarophilus]|jgi:hypothetical protein|uniref:DUF6876 family protein n=1 Tax=Calidithermus chliarophilus TaxID=52023 RepID=UPI000427B132|nr:DUF6876 family protein [Calidithermus chliarophilus]
MATLTAHELQAQLHAFTGTERYHAHWCGGSLLLTDGARFLAERAGAFWLMDVIASTLPLRKWDPFVRVRVERDGCGAKLTLDDGDGKVYYFQHVPYTDFPLEECTLYAAWDEGHARYVVMLPGEY